MGQEPQPWGGDVRLPGWLRRILRRPPEAEDTAEAAHEARQSKRDDYARLEHMRAAGTLAPHHSELPGGESRSRRS
jgi:hypothetical protein